MDKKYIVAFEISGSQIKGALASADGRGGSPTVEAIVSDDQISCVRYGRVQNLADATRHVAGILSKLQKSPVLGGRRITGTYVGIAGRSLTSQRAVVELNLPTEMEVTPEILSRLESDALNQVPMEKLGLKVLPRRYKVDNQFYSNPVGVLGRTLQGDFTIVTCNPVNKTYVDMVFNERIGLPVLADIVTPLAIGDMVLGDEEKELGCALVDMGAQTTTISIYKERCMQYIATLPIGSHNITRDLSIGLNITEENAETTKRIQGDALNESQGADAPKINSFVQARASEIIANIKAQIEFAGFRADDLAAGFVLTGRGVRLRNFDRLLENNTRMAVRKAAVPSDIRFDLKDPTTIPSDYISLLAIIDKACTDPAPGECVERGPEIPSYTTPTDQSQRHAATRPQQPSTPPAQRQTASYDDEYQRQGSGVNRPVTPYTEEIDDENWYKDEPEKKAKEIIIPDNRSQRRSLFNRNPQEKPAREPAPDKPEKKAKKQAEEPKKPKKPSMLQAIKDKLTKALSTDPDETFDTDIDN